MKDVAEHAEVSLMTISRVLNTPEKVSPLTLKKIKKAIAELEYVPEPFYLQRACNIICLRC